MGSALTVAAPKLSGTVTFTATPVGGGTPIALGSATFSGSTELNQTLLTVYETQTLATMGFIAGTSYTITGAYTDTNYPSYTFGGPTLMITN